MQKNANLIPRRFASKVGKTLKVALPTLVIMFAAGSANAGEIVRYNYVDDAVGTADQFQNGGLLKSFFGVGSGTSGSAINFGYNTTPDISPLAITGNRVTVDTTAWDAPGAPQPSRLNVDYFTSFGRYTQSSITVTPTETPYRFSFDSSGGVRSFGFYTPNNLIGTNGSNPYYRGRNFRVILSGVNADTPRDVTCTGVVDGGTYASIPNSLSGTTTPLLAGAVIGVHEVYLSLQRKTDNLYWSGTQWSTAQVNLPTNITLYNSFSPNQSWQIANPLPTLSSGQYAIRVMAVQGLAGSPSPGLLRVVDFTISGGDTTLPLPASLVSPAPGSTATSLSLLSGTCADNPGGSGVNRVVTEITYEGPNSPWNSPNPLSWDYVARKWVPYVQHTWNNFPDAQVINGTNWNTSPSRWAAPTGAQLYNGWYWVRFFTSDNAGNMWSYNAAAVFINNSGGSPGPLSIQSAATSSAPSGSSS